MICSGAMRCNDCTDYVQCVAPIKTQDFASVQKESRDDLKTIKNKKKTALASGFSIFDCIDYSTTICST